MDDLHRLTPLVIVALPLLIGLLDVVLYYLGGNDATISKVMLNNANASPLVALSTGYGAGVLIGHFFFPAFAAEPPPPYQMIARMSVVLSPVMYALIIIGAGDAATKAHTHPLLTDRQGMLAALVVLLFTLGGVAGKFALPQHLTPAAAEAARGVE
jgi:hypothetical protein